MNRLLFVLLFIATAGMVQAQDLKTPALSPTCKMTQDFSTSTIELTYSRPSMRGRKIFGELIPYGKVWRTGANGATKIKFAEDVTIGGKPVKAGEYALYTIPGTWEWEVVLNKGTSNWGAYGYDSTGDVARFKVKAEKMQMPMQTFTMDFSNITMNSCEIFLGWEKTMIMIPVYADNSARIMASIDKARNKPNIPYFQAASYYFESGQDLEKADMYVDKALEQNPKGFFMWYLKAHIEAKMGHKDEAIAAATKSMETAKGSAAEDEYMHNNLKLIDELNNKNSDMPKKSAKSASSKSTKASK
jgi:tetratricopeptide (TPR) repeat protein